MELTVIDDYSTSSSKILEATKRPDKTKDVQGSYGSLIVDPTNDKWFKDKCSLSCLVIIAVSGNLVKEDQTINFKIQVSQEFQELVEGMTVDGVISSKTGQNYNQKQIDRSRYRYFKFFKACGQECDVNLDIYPHGLEDNVMSVLVNYQDPRDEKRITSFEGFDKLLFLLEIIYL